MELASPSHNLQNSPLHIMSCVLKRCCSKRKTTSAAVKTSALLVVPPFLNYSAGPLLGPALLQAAARKRGHFCSILDLNALWNNQFRSGEKSVSRGPFVGDHDKPTDRWFLKEAEQSLYGAVAAPFRATRSCDDESLLKRIQYGHLWCEEVESMAIELANDDSPDSFGSFVREQLELAVIDQPLPKSLGLSILHAGQVIPSITIGMIAREMFPNLLVVWGGPHISGLGEKAFERNLQRRRYAADIFVSGHAEETFVDILEYPAYRETSFGKNKVQFLQGNGGSVPYAPIFENLHLYDQPPVFPAQSTLGCAYGRCAFGTYPKMEPVPRKLDLNVTVQSVVDQAVEVGGTIALKDSLVTPKRLGEIGDIIGGRVKWSACTKLHPKLVDIFLLASLANNGLTTLEVGLESLLPWTQRRVAKEHPPLLFEEFLATASNVPELCVVVNYITDFPWENKEESQAGLHAAKEHVGYYLGDRGKVEHNTFELERQSPMAQSPEKYNISSETLLYFPWSSVVQYQDK